MTSTFDNDDEVPTLLSWSAGDNCSLRAPRRVCSTAVCDLTCSTGHQQPVCRQVEAKLPDNTQSRAGPGTSARLDPVHRGFAPHIAVTSVTRTLAPDRGDAETGVGNYIMVTVMRRAAR